MSLVQIMPTAVKGTAQELENIRQADMETLKKIRVLILGLEEYWKGQAQMSFVNKYLSQQNNLNEFYRTLEELIQILNNASSKAEGIDSELLSVVNRI